MALELKRCSSATRPPKILEGHLRIGDCYLNGIRDGTNTNVAGRTPTGIMSFGFPVSALGIQDSLANP